MSDFLYLTSSHFTVIKNQNNHFRVKINYGDRIKDTSFQLRI